MWFLVIKNAKKKVSVQIKRIIYNNYTILLQ